MKLRLSSLIPYIISVAIVFFIFQIPINGVDYYLSDLFTRYQISHQASNQVVLVTISQSTIRKLGQEPNLNQWNLVLNTIFKKNPAAVFITKDFAVWDDDTETQALIEYSQDDINKLKQLSDNNPLYFQVDRMFLSGEKTLSKLKAPFDFLKTLSAPKTSDSALFAKDGVTRRVLLDYQSQPLGHYFLAKKVKPTLPDDVVKLNGAFELYDSNQIWIDYIPIENFKDLAFECFLDLNSDTCKDENLLDLDLSKKIVIVNEDLGKSFKKYVKTPYSKGASLLPEMSVSQMHAQAIDTIIRNSGVRFASYGLKLALAILLGFFIVYVSFLSRPTYGFLGLSLSFIILIISHYLFFNIFKWHLQMGSIFLALLSVYYVLLPYRLVIEQRKSWEIEQKHKILSQVEELKTNFISMMSHDLKTPIARIQGMADVIVTDAHILSLKQREAVDMIKASSEDLLRVLNAILNYAKIESGGVQLKMQPKDLNRIIEEVILQAQFLAKLKHVQIIFEEEPLFPISIDPDLIKQVFNNILENAIKYSPENTKILVTTEETESHVRVQISDQGMGISEQELEHIFSKFYRSQKVRSSQIKGSGLGLYLSNYFVRLHGGVLTVESQVSLGSTFTVELPIVKSS